MTVEEFAGFWKRQGCRTTKGAGTYWYAAHPFVFLSLPYHQPLKPTGVQLLRLFLTAPVLALRYPAETPRSNSGAGVLVCDRKDYDLTALHPKARNQTRKGLRECWVQRIQFKDLSLSGHYLNQDTWQRQGRDGGEVSPEEWQRYCRAAAQTPDMEAWGAFVDDRLAAFVVCALVDRCYNILYQSSCRDLLGHCPNNALAFTVTNGALEQERVDFVCYGLKSVESTVGLDHFKLGMGFTLRRFDERIVLHPVLDVGLSLGGRRAVQWAAARRPESDFWRKALAVCRMREG
jgi:hypothetical protein